MFRDAIQWVALDFELLTFWLRWRGAVRCGND